MPVRQQNVVVLSVPRKLDKPDKRDAAIDFQELANPRAGQM
ncbi:MAG TPA: hypothetical protein VN253_27445 [Kofleriaceae bacterium]|nr:hypothetical protein [Kofleriaceae bacterium]